MLILQFEPERAVVILVTARASDLKRLDLCGHFFCHMIANAAMATYAGLILHPLKRSAMTGFTVVRPELMARCYCPGTPGAIQLPQGGGWATICACFHFWPCIQQARGRIADE